VKALRNPTFIPVAYAIKRNALDNHVVLSLLNVVRMSHIVSYDYQDMNIFLFTIDLQPNAMS
jgi:hypothetical protein